jgi:hypothetical protein
MPANMTAEDILGYQGNLDHERIYPLLGVTVKIRSNDVKIIKNADIALGHWNNAGNDFDVDNSNLCLDIILQEEAEINSSGEEHLFIHRYRDDIYLANCDKNILVAFRNAGKGLAYVTEGLVNDIQGFNWFVVEALSLFLVTYRRRVPVHASAVTNGKLAVAFMGKSGAGKSSLAYVFMKHGFDLLAEDVIYFGMEDDFRIWGNSTKIHLLPDAIKLFPELSNCVPVKRPNGKIKIQVPVNDVGKIKPVHCVKNIDICLLKPDRNSRDSRIEPITPDYLRDYLLSSLEPGFNIELDSLMISMEKLLKQRLYLLTVGSDIDAVPDLVSEIQDI